MVGMVKGRVVGVETVSGREVRESHVSLGVMVTALAFTLKKCKALEGFEQRNDGT